MIVEIARQKGVLAACALGSALLLNGCAHVVEDVREEQDTLGDLARKGIPVVEVGSPVIIDASTFGASTPQGIAYHPERNTFFVSANGGGGMVYEIDTEGALLNSFSTGDYASEPEGITYDPRTGTLLIVNGNAQIFQVTTDGVLRQPSPMLDLSESISRDVDGIAIHPSTGNLWITDDYYENVYEIGRDGQLIGTMSTKDLINGFWEPEGLEFIAPDRILIADDRSGTSAIYEVTTNGDVVQMLDVSKNEFWDPEGVAFTGDRIAVVDGNSSRLLIAPYGN